jgi:uncharacterized Ntn-hydrolase superfamily protein
MLALTTLLVAPALAVAQSPVNDAYGSPVQDVNSAGGASLPFSGLDLGLIAVGGIALLALGFALRHVTRTQ